MRSIILMVLASLTLNAFGQVNMAKVAKSQSEKNELKNKPPAIGTIELGTLKRAIYKKNYHPIKYKKFVYLFDNQNPEFIELIEKSFKAWKINAVSYNSIINPNKNYTETEINQIFKENNVEAMFIIGYNKEYLTNQPGTTLHMSQIWNNRIYGYSSTVGTNEHSVTLFIDIYDINSGNEPFIRVRAESRTHVKRNIPDLVYKNMAYTLRGLQEANLLIPNIEQKSRKEKRIERRKERKEKR